MVSVKQTFVKSYFCANLDLHFSTQMTISTNIKDYYSFSYFKLLCLVSLYICILKALQQCEPGQAGAA